MTLRVFVKFLEFFVCLFICHLYLISCINTILLPKIKKKKNHKVKIESKHK